MVINILSAFYGRKSSAHCSYGDVSNTNCQVDATRYAKYYAQGKDYGLASANSAEFGDPCPGITKYLEIRYECKNPGTISQTSSFPGSLNYIYELSIFRRILIKPVGNL